MKKYFLIYLLIISFIVSCDDYLETESKSKFTEESVFSNLDFASKAVKGIYQVLTLDNMYAYSMGIYFKFDSDIECSYGANDGAINSLSHYAGTPSCSPLMGVWNSIYQTIERANLCIVNLPESPIWEGEYAKEAKFLYGEAVTLRALCYYELINIWGDVPFNVKSTEDGDKFYLPKTERDSIYEYLIQDLKDVEDYVPWMTETNTSERVNKAFVKGLRARMALAYAGYSLRNATFETRRGRYWEEYYKIANQECREIIASSKHQLNPDFENIFKKLNSYSMDLTYGEILFEIAYGRLVDGRVSYSIGMGHVTSPADPKYGKATSEIRITPPYYYTFDTKDLRRNVSVELYDYANKNTLGVQSLAHYSLVTLSPCKWRKSWITPTMGGDLKLVAYTGVNWPLMRYSDILLMYAETENEINNGPTQTAKDALSLIRKRAFPNSVWATKVNEYVSAVSASKESFFNAIVNERAWEFGGEMIRKYDLIRWNLLGTKIAQMKDDYQKIMNSDPKFANVPTYLFWKYNSDGEKLDILNPDYRLSETAIPGYTRASWTPLLSASSKATYTKSVNIVGNGYDAAKNNYLYPIAAEIITASNGVLTNDQIP